MSSDILYDSVGIRLRKRNLFLNLSKIGSTNIYEAASRGRSKRARDWSFWTPLGSKPFTQEAIIEDMLKWRERVKERNEEIIKKDSTWGSTYNDNSFGWYASVMKYGKRTSTTSFKEVYNFFVKSPDKCIDFDDYLKVFPVYVELPYYCIPDNLNESVLPEKTYVHSEEELYKVIEDYALKYTNLNFYVKTDVGEWHSSKKILQKCAPKLIEQFIKSKREKKSVLQDHFFTVYFNGYGYFKKMTRRYISYSAYPCKYFRTENQAKSFINKRLAGGEKFVVERINSQKEFFI
jgi:hypothetical protein